MVRYGADGRVGEDEEKTKPLILAWRYIMERILILGMGGHAKSIVDAIERENKYEIAGYVVNDDTDSVSTEKYPILGNDNDLHKLFLQGIHNAAIGIGFLGNSNLRKRLYEKIIGIGYNVPIVCDPTAIIASGVSVGEGTFIGKGTILNTDSKIGKMCIINTGAIVEHDCLVGDFSHISVGTVLCGEVSIGKDVFVGANATVIQGRQVADTCIVGAGEVVRRNVMDGKK